MNLQEIQPVSRTLNVGSTERKASLAAGTALIFEILRRRPKLSVVLPLGLGAGYLIYRGATGHCYLYQKLEIARSEEGTQGIQVQRAVTIKRPKDELFRIWRNFENLPRFMTHLKSVRLVQSDGRKRWHWVTNAPLGKSIEWDSEVIHEVENEYLAWRSLPGSPVESRGSVSFSDAPGERGTVVAVSMQYHPPAGSMGAAFAKLFGEEPSQQIRDDLRHFKQIMETGEIASVEGQTSGRSERFGRSIAERHREKDVVEQASLESFPASDPPSWTVSRGASRR